MRAVNRRSAAAVRRAAADRRCTGCGSARVVPLPRVAGVPGQPIRWGGQLDARALDAERAVLALQRVGLPEGDAWLAESGRRRLVEQRRVAREELRTGHRAE